MIEAAILSTKGDLHAFVLQKALRERRNIACHVVETDGVCSTGGLTWSETDCSLPTSEGKLIDVRKLDLIWLRRFNGPQDLPPYVTEQADREIINSDCKYALMGLLTNEFSGTWISEPQATLAAENKLTQLRVANAVGLRTPQTLVSQNPEKIRQFCADLDNNVVIKGLKQSSNVPPLFTAKITEHHLQASESMRLAPAIYQEYIDGYQHIRVNYFGTSVYAAMIETHDLDWRRNLNVPFTEIELDAEVQMRLCEVLRRLRLKMGVFDLKLDRYGEPVWLELNPQGQFLFVQALTGSDLISAMTNFLYEEAQAAMCLRLH